MTFRQFGDAISASLYLLPLYAAPHNSVSLIHLPVSALVGTDAAETPCGLQMGNVLLDRLTRNPQCGRHPDLRQVRLRLEQIGQAVNGFLTTFF